MRPGKDPLGKGCLSKMRRSTSIEENKAVFDPMAEAMDRADFDAFEELLAPELAEEFKQGIAELRLAFPDYHTARTRYRQQKATW